MTLLPGRIRACALLLPVLFVASACDIAMADYREQQTEEWRKTYELPAGGRVEVSNVNGKIDVVTGEGNGVEIVARKIGKGASEEAAKQALSRIQIIESTAGGTIKVETRLERGGGLFNHGSGAQVEYMVRVPTSVNLTVSTVNGGVEIAGGITGRITAEATNGGIQARDVRGPIEASTINGGVQVELAAVAADGVKLECTNGGLHLRLPSDAKATISARVSNGGIETSGLAVSARGEATNRRLDGDLNGGGPRIQLEGTNGGITIRAR